MLARHWLVAVLLLGVSTAVADDVKPKAYDIKPYKDQFQVFQDSHGGTYVVYLTAESDPRVFYGTGKSLYLQTDMGVSRDGDAWSIRAYAPRMPEAHYGFVERKSDGTYKKTCGGKDDAILTQLTGDKAKAVIEKYSFLTPGMVYTSALFARDDAGVYYYVDHLTAAYGGKGYRVFVGKKGAMKQLPLTDVAIDSGGYVFSTKTGDLRLVKTNNTSVDESLKATNNVVWIKGEKRMPLTWLDTYVNSELIFGELGIYTFLGTICDNVI
jgi:hypothetical protein